MRKFHHTFQTSFVDPSVSCNQNPSFQLKLVCDDGVIYCDRLLFILWSQKWLQILDPLEENSVLIFPDIQKQAMELLIDLLRKGSISGMESDFENFMELALDFLVDFPGGFSNFETSDEEFKVKAVSIKNRRNCYKFKTTKEITCEFCVSTFASKQSKDRHIENHHQPKEIYNCSICNMKFKSKEGLTTHNKIKHSDGEAKDLYCKLCDLRFTNETNLKRHIKSKHGKEDYICLHCMKVFEFKSEFLQHQKDFKHIAHRARNIEKKDAFSCPYCDFKTNRKDNLARHKRLKHQIFKKEFEAIDNYLKDNSSWTCTECDQTFTNADEIEDHVINCKEIKCKFCEKKFTLKSNLKRHLEKKHPHVCKICNERFKNKKKLREHIEKVH